MHMGVLLGNYCGTTDMRLGVGGGAKASSLTLVMAGKGVFWGLAFTKRALLTGLSLISPETNEEPAKPKDGSGQEEDQRSC